MNKLKVSFPYPTVKPSIEKDFTNGRPTGWCNGVNIGMFEEIITPEMKVIIDGGSFMGCSASHFLELAPNASIICIDHWKGSIEHQQREDVNELFEKFIVNMWDHKDRVFPVRKDSTVGLLAVKAAGVEPDLIYIDWSHDTTNVINDITEAYKLFPDAIICGDDYTWPSVKKAVQIMIDTRGFEFKTYETCWRLL